MQIRKQIEPILALINAQEWVAQLLVRLFVGYFFMETGWGKLHNLDGFAQRFAGWGIPYPYFNAALSAYTEFIGGWLTIFGFGTRMVSIPMIINMLVAILKVNLKRVTTLDDFVELDEPLYALAYLWLLLSGPGWVSVDHVVSRVFGLKEKGMHASFAERADPRFGAVPGLSQDRSSYVE
jgi:putative oxidoreductase